MPSLKKKIQKFKSSWKNYIFQSIFASLAVWIVIMALSFQELVIVAAIGATAFIVFAMPKQITARARNIIGGYLVGIAAGTIFSLFPQSKFSTVIYALAVGFSILVMVMIDVEHPPASGVALSIAIEGFSFEVVFTVLVSVTLLALIHHFFKPYLKDLV
ncbi:MAG: HPP family protein [Candidatus Omnitrophota bacterium]